MLPHSLCIISSEWSECSKWFDMMKVLQILVTKVLPDEYIEIHDSECGYKRKHGILSVSEYKHASRLHDIIIVFVPHLTSSLSVKCVYYIIAPLM